jgi:Tfp pilus assembly protein PilF
MLANERIKALKLLLEKEPEDSFLNYALALEIHKEGDTSQAIQKIVDLLRLDPSYLGAYLQLGQLYESQGMVEKAAAIYKQGLDLATKQNNKRTLSELQQALMLLED